MKRRILMFVLGAGTILGYGSAFFHAGHCQRARRDAFEQHIAKVCVGAAKSASVGSE